MIDRIRIADREIKIGDSVILRPRSNSDALDIILAGRLATIASFEEDFEGRIHVAVTINDDPGRDLGMVRQTAHRFFYAPNELEPCSPEF